MPKISKLHMTTTLSLIICDTSSVQGQQLFGPSNQSEAYFNGSSYLRLQNTISLKQPTGLNFRTCVGGNLLSQQQNEDTIELLVDQKGVIFRSKVDGVLHEESIKGNYVNNRWHTVYLQYRLGNLTLEVDGRIQLLANSSYHTQLISSDNLYDEGAAILLIGKNFNGCLLEGPSVVFSPDLITSSHNVMFEVCPIPLNSCTPVEKKSASFDHCLTEPCMRHGTCINTHTDYTCVCLPRYGGKNCEIDLGNPCEKRPSVCKNGATCSIDLTGDFVCSCPPGFTGRRCENEVKIHPLCKVNPCLNGGTCDIDPQNEEPYCLCRPGFAGDHCEINLDECKSHPCLNGGDCIDGLNNFTCDCEHTGYTGKICEININECQAAPCLNGGVCFDTYGSYLCQCHPGFGGKNCQFNVDECASQPCFNNGVCVSKATSYECKCLPGYLGDNCEIEQRQQRQHSAHCEPGFCPPYADCINDPVQGPHCVCKSEYPGEFPICNNVLCTNNPCKNGGVCSITNNGNVNCTCSPGFTGFFCEKVSLCKPGTCKNGGTCINHSSDTFCACPRLWKGPYCEHKVTCKDRPCKNAIFCEDYFGEYFCTCAQGWTGVNCDQQLGPCIFRLCKNGAVCENRGYSFKCHCPSGYRGKLCQININECISNPCLNGGICIDKIDSFMCNCTDQWMGPICEKPYDICELTPCYNNGSCISSPNKHDYTCECVPGFDGSRCETNVNDCEHVKCPPGQICVDKINAYECQCPHGYIGDDCNVDMDPCGTQSCNNGTCIVDPGSGQAICKCHPGFTGPHCDMDIDECKIPGSKICNHGICVNTEGSFHCYCTPGYTGERCNLDFNECLSMPCKNNATCVNLVNNYDCMCPPGYEGKDCSQNIDECAPEPCREGATCVDGINEFTCICQPGLTGKLCDVNIDDCESSPCLNGAKCIDGLNEYTCDCTDTGYEGTHCEINIDDCLGNPCKNGAQCIDKVKDYDCDCYRGYTGKNCEIDINECESNPCKYDGICLERSNMTYYNQHIMSTINITLPESFNRPFNFSDAAGYECLCVPGVTGLNCEININECESNPCIFGQCEDQIGGYLCECDAGYDGERCEHDINECEVFHPCVHGECKDRVANYFCACESGYGGKNCSVELIGCTNKPCQNNGKCQPYLRNEGEHRFNCTCQNGYHGDTCEKSTTMSFSGNSLVIVNTSREEGYDIQFRFKTTLGDGLLALGKGLTYYILELSRGRLNLQSSLLNKWEGVFIGSNLNDSNWQKVFVAINSTHLVLSANEEQTIYPITFNEFYNVSSTSFPVTYIGGIPSNLRKLTHGAPFMVGCAEDVLINSEWVLPEETNSSSLTFSNIEVGCLRKPQCNPNPCHSGGRCTDKWRDFSCTCERPYLGHTCQYNYTAATFGHEGITDSLVTVDVADYARRAVRTIVDISMFIRTRQSKGQIFYLGSGSGEPDETYVAAQLEGGELYVKIQFNGSSEAYTVGGVKLDNGYNHLIEVTRNYTLVQVKLNGTEYFRKTISATGILDAQMLFLGGQPQLRAVRQATENLVTTKVDLIPTAPASITAPLSNVNFKGIIQDVQISNGSNVMVVEFFPLTTSDVIIPPPFGVVSFDKSLVLEGVLSDDLCQNKPCHHNGECVVTWNDYRCECPRGFKGKDCNELEFCELEGCPVGSFCKNLEDGYECIANATFNGKSDPLIYHLTILPNSTLDFEVTSIELTYRTRSWGTILFAKHQTSYFAVFIYHNEVVVQWKIDEISTAKRFKKDRFEGQWLTILLTVTEQKLVGGFKENVMDELPNFEEHIDLKSLSEIFINGDIFVAGSDNRTFDYKSIIDTSDLNATTYVSAGDSTTVDPLILSNSLESGELYMDDTFLYKIDQNKHSDRFKGCLSEIRINGLLLPYFSTKEIYKKEIIYADELFELEPLTKPDLGCVLCYNTDCQNEGQCINSTSTYKCQCHAGYAADDCSIDIDECQDNKCQNNATCVDMVAKYLCDCPLGYEGQFCETDINECASNPCKHGGTCYDLIGTFKCECAENFVGKQCEAPLLITCENKPCKEGATCVTGPNEQTGNNFTCHCTEGMEGMLCDTPFCQRKHCNYGFCNTTDLVPYCECQLGFEGKYCEVNIDECSSVNGKSPCQNRAACIDGIARYDCNCTGTGFTGLLCEMDIDECKLDPFACGEDGVCENTLGNYRCTCNEPGKCGHHCSLDDPCIFAQPCEHGVCESMCTDLPDYFCKCEENYIGKNCTDRQEAATDPDSGINILYIVVPIVLILLIGFVIGMIILINVARTKRATRGTYSPSAQEFCNPRVELDHVLKPPPEERLI